MSYHRLFKSDKSSNLEAIHLRNRSTANSNLKHTMNKRSLVIVEANASANPAVEALMLGVTRHTKPVTPTTTAESRLKRTESQRFTTNDGLVSRYSRIDLAGHTSPHPVVRVSVLPSIWAYELIGQGSEGKPYRHSEAYHARTSSKLQKHELSWLQL